MTLSPAFLPLCYALRLCLFFNSFTDKLKPFWCYNISVYPVLQDQVGEPYSIQVYAKEGSMYGQTLRGKGNIGASPMFR
jgi:hypothetical protein